MGTNNRLYYGMDVVFVCLKALDLSNVCQVYPVECVSKIKPVLAIILYTIYGTVCFLLTHLSCDEYEYVYFSHTLGLNHETMVWAVCLFFVWLLLVGANMCDRKPKRLSKRIKSHSIWHDMYNRRGVYRKRHFFVYTWIVSSTWTNK